MRSVLALLRNNASSSPTTEWSSSTLRLAHACLQSCSFQGHMNQSVIFSSINSQVRCFAAKGSSGSAAADGKKKRRSYLKMYSCRSDKVRSSFEQVWPTLQLTREELELFKRNSRVFVTDLGRSIPLKTKYNLAKDEGPEQKVHHLEARPLIYESDLHLDAIGEHPRYLKIRRLRAGNYATKLQSVRKLRLMLGFSRRKTLQRMYEFSKMQPGPDRVWKFICAMEGKLPTAALRMGLAHDALVSRIFAEKGMLYVNGVKPLEPKAMFVQPGDVISVGAWAADWHLKYYVSQLGHELLSQAEGVGALATGKAVQAPRS